MSALFDLTGKVAVVTGAGAGLGARFSQALAQAGASVVCSDINTEHAERTAATLKKDGFKAVGIHADVTSEADIEQMIQRAVDEFGGVDILVNNAGIGGSIGAPETVSIDEWKRTLDINLTGVFACAQAAARAMIAAGKGGSIINLASILGHGASEPVPASAYAATKGAVVNLTRDLAVHWASHNIRVNALGPAYFPSDMTGGLVEDKGLVAEIERRTPMGRMGRQEELDGPVVFLASDASSYITGQTLYVDGGWTAWG
jgi:NAD(P)-dependent dehydrogenase (short-subunit alcohol dehydrogenase family)